MYMHMCMYVNYFYIYSIHTIYPLKQRFDNQNPSCFKDHQTQSEMHNP